MAESVGKWDTYIFCCDIHKEMMQLVSSAGRVEYTCSHPGCNNGYSVSDAEKIMNHISAKLIETVLQNEIADLTNHSWTVRKYIVCRITEHTAEQLTISINNKLSALKP